MQIHAGQVNRKLYIIDTGLYDQYDWVQDRRA